MMDEKYWDKRNIDAYDGLVMSLFEEK